MTPEPPFVYWDRFEYDEWTFHVAATDRGICRITLPNEKFDALQQWCKKHAPGSDLVRDPVKLRPYIEQIEEYLSGQRKDFSVPLDLRGTPFQIRVWRTLLDIPFGATRSYSQIGESIGNPTAVRAVGATNGANPIPIVVPCHRVIGKSGNLTGYRGGVDMKARLLMLEGV
ncbi:methylated-DNA--[protein]-cysteine S-methyltransferase [Alicyclobacillus sp. ALC3]|uniref:methylated-DNA--[protein]-cysteine S-methyltransferase n=1 Tax=Alicyclobacillus sp. ALC3 TaxID=2796143 RepID=UPI002379A388|nr:methylated-DNA--[protein]-cysteine S-methyltransferase [Alicyclobacillus sp. ALC3]WDL96721.1 methylated-DNA--[protein]-cysteine S-methyltransferase [Alicyclobacillus sp. ALC3]